MTLSIQLGEDQERALRLLAERRGVRVEEIAREVIVAYTARVDDATFRKALDASLRKNAELLRRLA